MPKFDELDKHLTLHARWVKSLPWYPPIASPSSMGAKQMFHGIIAATRPEDYLPHDDEGYSGIWDDPVRHRPQECHQTPPSVTIAMRGSTASARALRRLVVFLRPATLGWDPRSATG
ncbi:unnamed protein product [Peniophora sp. CBMAI 1063]|nr:unnamed protein product [Peniophora sp. CBMAI 1063]